MRVGNKLLSWLCCLFPTSPFFRTIVGLLELLIMFFGAGDYIPSNNFNYNNCGSIQKMSQFLSFRLVKLVLHFLVALMLIYNMLLWNTLFMPRILCWSVISKWCSIQIKGSVLNKPCSIQSQTHIFGSVKNGCHSCL